MTLTHAQLQATVAATAAGLCLGAWAGVVAGLHMLAAVEYPAQKPNFDTLPTISRGDDRVLQPPS